MFSLSLLRTLLSPGACRSHIFAQSKMNQVILHLTHFLLLESRYGHMLVLPGLPLEHANIILNEANQIINYSLWTSATTAPVRARQSAICWNLLIFKSFEKLKQSQGYWSTSDLKSRPKIICFTFLFCDQCFLPSNRIPNNVENHFTKAKRPSSLQTLTKDLHVN